MTIDEIIKFCYEKAKNIKLKAEPQVFIDIAERLEKLKTIENIMLTYNANWYADEDNGVPDCEVLESIWNVIQDNGLDIDIEQDYRKGKSDGYNKALDDFISLFESKRCIIYTKEYVIESAEQLKAGVDNETN